MEFICVSSGLPSLVSEQRPTSSIRHIESQHAEYPLRMYESLVMVAYIGYCHA